MLNLTAKVGLKAATLGVIKNEDIEALNDIKNDIAEGTSEVLGKFMEERISTYKDEIQSIITFHQTLESVAAEISKENSKPLVFMIDELDRCKPTYAIDLIEKVKHIFSVKNIIFILVMHKTQLEESVRCVYGQKIDANTYLQKFINLECPLPKNVGRIDDYEAYSGRLFKLHKIEAAKGGGILILPTAL